MYTEWNVEIVLVAAFSSAFHADIWGAHSVKPPTQRPSKLMLNFVRVLSDV